MNADDYTSLITSEHNDKPLFMAVVVALCQGLVDVGNRNIGLPDDFDLDGAVGVQLDAVGLWVGISRVLPIPITGVYFSWDDTTLTGWESGIWQGPFDPSSGLTSLPDDQYRLLLRAKIAANHWDGSLQAAEAIWNFLFGGSPEIIVQDNQDMSMTVAFYGPPLSAVQQALLLGGYFPLKPSGVRVNYYGVPVDANPLFAWDVNSPELQGWGTGSWVKEISS